MVLILIKKERFFSFVGFSFLYLLIDLLIVINFLNFIIMANSNYGLETLSASELVKFRRILSSYYSLSTRPSLKKFLDLVRDEVDFRLSSYQSQIPLSDDLEK